MNNFWEAFWPNFASTIAGLLVGIPLALWINRKTNKSIESNNKKREIEISKEIIKILMDEHGTNILQVHEIMQLIKQKKVSYIINLKYETWKVHNYTLVKCGIKVDDFIQLNTCFSEAYKFQEIYNNYLDRCNGVMSALSNNEPILKHLEEVLDKTRIKILQAKFDSDSLIRSIS